VGSSVGELAGVGLERDAMARRPKIAWSPEERELLAAKGLELRMLRVFDSPLHLFRSAQAALPPERRRRTVRTLGEIPWFVPAVDCLLAEAAARKQSDLVATILDWHRRHLDSLEQWHDRHIKILEELQAIHRTIAGAVTELGRQRRPTIAV
jgi:hypothetical protein